MYPFLILLVFIVSVIDLVNAVNVVNAVSNIYVISVAEIVSVVNQTLRGIVLHHIYLVSIAQVRQNCQIQTAPRRILHKRNTVERWASVVVSAVLCCELV